MFAIMGATGKIGRATIRALRGRGAPVRALVRDPATAGELRGQGCEIVACDLRDVASIRAATSGAETVQVIVPISSRGDDAATEMRRIIDGIGEALDAVRPPGVLAISDYGAEVPRGTGVTLAFHHLEARLGQLSSAVTFVRSAEHMQNWSRFLKTAADTGVLPSLHHPLTKRFPTVAAGDVGVVAAELMASRAAANRRIVHVEGPRRYNPLEVAATIRELLDRDVVAREIPRASWIPALVGGGLSPSYAELVAALFDAHNAGRIDAEPGVGEIRRGTTELRDVFAALLGRPS